MMATTNRLSQISAASQNGKIDISCSALKRPLMIGDDGFLNMGAYGYSYYYSQTMLNVIGTLTLNGFTEPISGTAWVDHQYGELMSVVNEEYEWFCIQLYKIDTSQHLELSDLQARLFAFRF